MNMYMQDWSCNAVFDASIQCDNDRFRICWSIEHNFIEFVKMRFSGFDTFLIWKKKKWLENKSTNLLPRENSWLNRSKDFKMPFNLLLASMMGPLIFNFCFGNKFFIDSW